MCKVIASGQVPELVGRTSGRSPILSTLSYLVISSQRLIPRSTTPVLVASFQSDTVARQVTSRHWLLSPLTVCTSSLCNPRPFVSSSHRHHVQIQNGVYGPTQFPRATGSPFGINSLQGSVGGRLFGMEIGGYSIQYQALGACLVSCHLPFHVILTFVCLFVAAALTVTSES